MMKHTLFLLTALLGLLLSGCSTQKISDDQIISDLIGKQVGSYNYRALQEVVDYKIELKNENDNIKEYEVLLIMKEMETNRYYFHHLLQTYILKDDKFEVGQNTFLGTSHLPRFLKLIQNLVMKVGQERCGLGIQVKMLLLFSMVKMRILK